MNNIALLLVCRLHKIIWNILCELALHETSNRRDILSECKRNLKRHITFENKRLTEEEFTQLYARNNALCLLKNQNHQINFFKQITTLLKSNGLKIFKFCIAFLFSPL